MIFDKRWYPNFRNCRLQSQPQFAVARQVSSGFVDFALFIVLPLRSGSIPRQVFATVWFFIRVTERINLYHFNFKSLQSNKKFTFAFYFRRQNSLEAILNFNWIYLEEKLGFGSLAVLPRAHTSARNQTIMFAVFPGVSNALAVSQAVKYTGHSVPSRCLAVVWSTAWQFWSHTLLSGSLNIYSYILHTLNTDLEWKNWSMVH